MFSENNELVNLYTCCLAIVVLKGTYLMYRCKILFRGKLPSIVE